MDPEPHLEPIPRPPGHVLVGNLFDLDAGHPIESLMELARKYGPIFELAFPAAASPIVVSSFELVDELCDEFALRQEGGGGLSALAKGPVGRGLFTSETQDPNWRKAHNVLLPAFSMDAMRGYYPRMLDVAVQLMQKWERLNPDDTVDVPADMTRLTLDTIALCGFNYRFNSFYRDTLHPFVVAMLGTLEAAQAQAKGTADPKQAAPRARPEASRRPGAHGSDRAASHRGAAQLRRAGDHQRPARSDADRRRPSVGREARRDQHHRTVHHLPDRRATRRQAACCPSRSMPYSRIPRRWRGATKKWTGCWARI